jgi:hypothetical protein
MFEAGLDIVLGTDDPTMFGTSMNHCWRTLFAANGWGQAEARRLSLAASRQAGCPRRVRRRCARSFPPRWRRLIPLRDFRWVGLGDRLMAALTRLAALGTLSRFAGEGRYLRVGL